MVDDPLPPSRASGVGVIGLGKMGSVMAERLAAAGLTLHVYDIDRAAAERVVPFGAVTAHGTLDGVAEAAATVILMLPNSDVVERVVLGGGLLDGARRGDVIVDMSSSEPLRTRVLAERAAERGVDFLDAPVSGGVAAAVKGTLTIMVGGSNDTLELVRPVLGHLGSRIVHVGPPGAGHAVKALNNLMSASHLLATSEAMRAAESFGLDLAVVLDVVNTSSGRSGSTENKWPNFVLPGSFDSGFSLDLMVKDMRIALGLAEAGGVDARLARLATDLWAEAAGALPAGADHTEIAKWAGTPASAVRPSPPGDDRSSAQ
jgi:3-hydroxyisobutyrate dehydrogenase